MKTRWFTLVAIFAAALCLLTSSALAADVKVTDRGLIVSVKGMGDFNFGFPTLQPGKLSPLEKKIEGKKATLTYKDGVIVHLEVTDDSKALLRFENASGIKSFGVGTQFGLEYGQGGTWAIGAGSPQPFPAEKPENPHIYQGNAGGFTVTDPSGKVLSVTGFPDFTYQELNDLREWNTRRYSWKISVPYNPHTRVYTLQFAETPHNQASSAAPTERKILVDRFGQTTLKDFPGKVTSEEELKADAAKEAEYWATYSPLPVDKWGGLPGTKEKLGLQATGFFHVEQRDGKWLLVNPDGNVTFHLGVCVFTYNPGDEATYIKDRHDIYEWIPPVDSEYAPAFHPDRYWRKDVFSFYVANLIRKYGPEVTKDEQLARMVDRVRAVGFNAVGAFSGYSPAFTEKHFPRMGSVSFNPALPGIRGVADPFDEEARRKTEESWAQSLTRNADDPLIIGYFFGNEQGFEDIPRAVPQLSGKYAAKRKLVEILKTKYATIAEFNEAWGVNVADFDALADTALPVATKAAYADMQEYTELFLEEYYKFISETFRKYDKNHLMVASRWQPGTANNETLCRVAGKYMDIISINYYGWGVDRSIPDRIYRWTGGKPQMWSEFFFSSGPESNAAPYNRDMATQKLRGQAYRQYVEHAAATGYVVGIEWFSLIDQAVTGRWFSRLSGERYNNGLFNACDRPYDDCLREMAATHSVIYDVLLEGRKPFVLDDPRVNRGVGAKKEMQAAWVSPGSMKIDGQADGWPGRPPELFRSVKPAGVTEEQPLEVAFKMAWDNNNLYLLANVTDPTPMNNPHEGFNLWRGDAVEVFIGIEDIEKPGGLLFTDRQLLIASIDQRRAGDVFMVNSARQPQVEFVCVPWVDGTGYTMEAAIPWTAFDYQPKEGDLLLFEIAVDDAPPGGDRTRQIWWNGGSSRDRTNWGLLRLVP